MSFFENLLELEVHPMWITIILQHYKPYGDMKAGKNSMGSKAMGYSIDAMKVCCKNHQVLILLMNAAMLLLMYMLNCLKMQEGTGLCFITMQLELSEKMKFLMSKHPENKPLDDVQLCTILLFMVL